MRTLPRIFFPIFLLILFSLLAGAASAQNLSAGNVFAGYSFARATLAFGQNANLNGWNISAEKKYLPFLGIVVDASGHYGPANISAVACNGASSTCYVSGNVQESTFQLGVRGSYSTGRIRPFAEFLLGAALVNQSAQGFSNSSTGLIATLETGIDVQLTRHFAWRTDAGLIQTGSFPNGQNSLRASSGLAYFF